MQAFMVPMRLRVLVFLILGSAPLAFAGCPSQSAMATGYEISVTAVQLAAAYGAIANDGVLLAPTLVKTIRERGLLLPAVALTGYASAEDRQQALEAGFDDHLGKPVSPDMLVQVLENVIRRP